MNFEIKEDKDFFEDGEFTMRKLAGRTLEKFSIFFGEELFLII